MKHILCWTVILSVSIGAYAQTDREAQGWQMVWQDEFDSINHKIWVVENHFDHWGGELQVYTSRPENVYIDNGNLVLRPTGKTIPALPNR